MSLVQELSKLSESVSADIQRFNNWLSFQKPEHRFNIACLFTVDAAGSLRVCLHPKIVRSHFEMNVLAEGHMLEADLLTLVTLHPTNKEHLSITLQPLICSDALDLRTDIPGANPIKAVNLHASSFEGHLPDHIDIITVTTCTPQREYSLNESLQYREWHEKFQDSFKASQEDPNLVRHHFSAFVLSNFKTMPEGGAGGLSGVFLPVAPTDKPFPDDVVVSCWGTNDPKRNNRWSQPADDALNKWKTRGFVASLDPFSPPINALVKIFYFTIQQLPREKALWTRAQSLTNCKVRVGYLDKSDKLQIL